MEFPYTIKDISIKVGKTSQSLYTLINKNKEFINENSRKNGRYVKYNQAVLDWFINYYGLSQDEEVSQNDAKMSENAPEIVSSSKGENMTLKEAKMRIAVLEEENKDLRTRLAASEEERRLANENVGRALLALNEERAERQRLLPAPSATPPAKKSFSDVVKGIFTRKNTQTPNETNQAAQD